MNILLINHYAGSITHGMEYRPYYLAREWVKQGHHVTIAAASYSHVRREQPALCGGLGEERIDGIRYVWLKTPRYSGNGVRRVLNMFCFLFRLWRHCRRVVGDYPPAAVIASSTYPLDIFPARRIAEKHGAKLLFEVHDLWPLTPIQIGGMSPTHPFVALLQFAENYAYRKSDRVISMLPGAFEYMREHGLTEDKFRYVPNGVDLAEWEGKHAPAPEQHAECLRSLRREKRFIVGYVGGHQPSNALATLLEAAEMVHDYPVAFVLVGQGSEKERLRKYASDRAIANVVFLPPVPKSSVPGLLAAMDALFIGWKKIPLYQYGISPNKLLDYMMAGKPVIHAVSSSNDLVADSGCGISCAGEDSRAVGAAVLRLLDCSDAERAAMGQRGKDYVIGHHQYSFLAEQYLKAIE
ncbi:MAG: glycosyltransferase family 4 protein [Pirellulales bacterium]|nr:glycosyltransferase family 4 protein [Pirellulales bacterium]